MGLQARRPRLLSWWSHNFKFHSRLAGAPSPHTSIGRSLRPNGGPQMFPAATTNLLARGTS